MKSTRGSLPAALGMAAVSILFLVLIAAPVQAAWGMGGLLLTELGLLALALGGTALLREKFADVFPLHVPRLRGVLGAIVLWLGAYLPVLCAAVLMQILLPAQTVEVSAGITGLIVTVPLWLRFLIVAVSPAICEEAVYRGFILYHLGPLPVWARVAVCGVLFGLFHLDVTRFLSTALLGAVIAWAVVCTGNLVYGGVIHLCNNALSVLATVVLEAAAQSAPELLEQSAAVAETAVMTPAMLGVYLILCVPSPWLLWAGTALLRGGPARPGRGRKALICLGVSALLAAAGAGLIAAG